MFAFKAVSPFTKRFSLGGLVLVFDTDEWDVDQAIQPRFQPNGSALMGGHLHLIFLAGTILRPGGDAHP